MELYYIKLDSYDEKLALDKKAMQTVRKGWREGVERNLVGLAFLIEKDGKTFYYLPFFLYSLSWPVLWQPPISFEEYRKKLGAYCRLGEEIKNEKGYEYLLVVLHDHPKNKNGEWVFSHQDILFYQALRKICRNSVFLAHDYRSGDITEVLYLSEEEVERILKSKDF